MNNPPPITLTVNQVKKTMWDMNGIPTYSQSKHQTGHGITSHYGPVLVATHRLKVVVASASKAGTGGLFRNCQDVVVLRTTLDEIGFPQGSTPVQTTLPLHLALSTTLFTLAIPRPFTCASFRSMIVSTRSSFSSIGIKVQPTLLTTSPNTINPHTIGQSSPPTIPSWTGCPLSTPQAKRASNGV